MVILAFLTTLISLIITPIVIKYAKKLNATDKPNYRKVHKDPIPTLGGLAIFMSFLIGLVILQPVSEYHLAIVIGGFIMIILGFFDDLFDLSPKVKFLTQILAASLVVFWGGLQVEFINLPFGGQIEFGFLSSVITIIWIAGVTNAINFIDGLDGLAAGVSSIALMTIAVMAIIMGNVYVATMALILFFSTMGFLRYNFNPAKIFMGDTGALFLGFMISVLALLGFKNVTIISFIIPIFILGVPISDTLIAMVRRYINKQPLSSPDSSHLHHRLVKFGLTHKQTVLFIYALSAMFSLAAILFSMTTVWGSILIFTIAMLAVQALIENLELINSEYKPLTNLLKGMRQKP
ncbi:undecaprenyl/decaprenyl-phosphate alpha-N-acetylglucosaminyl 1-phosphate transferase [Virgibacillus halodenitrificans]|uniref:Undecaprenyl-phosphate alpha-N-acetylglucosaminyl 1-phosphate transferase n=1 Tax=Virgibacillus halodenitrificans TaxID=1482 RepID=A0AAC9NN72_VIRHA|nr:MraY family glycosyltransferase [Virgibacillus halodenitrificans]APC50319.1 undecaprenyl-phosphate alpha-N-acetylglucosaminyl 1-phosphate transferase [Virgibacillus halodenitrificans]MCG1028133.1 undecaprenyl/decaprenyl-phosphate alpha-N-acetylglucosaminyl 1-phosphate transferase [Virgibacillus halodenitrificans]